MKFFKKNKNDFFNIKNKQHKNKKQNKSTVHIVQKFMKKWGFYVICVSLFYKVLV